MDTSDLASKLESLRDLHLSEGEKKIKKETILEETDLTSDDLQVIHTMGYLIREGVSNGRTYRLNPQGSQFIRDQETIDHLKESKEVNQDLIKHSKRSAAAETVFTYALLTFSWIQVTNGDYNIHSDLIDGLYLFSIMLSSAIGGGTIIGVLENYVDEISEELQSFWTWLFRGS